MLSRVAESIYWMSRQVERAENLARFLEVTHDLTIDQQQRFVDPWEPLIRVTADDEEFAERYGKPDAKSVTKFLAFDPDYSNSMLSCLHHARENARSVRETLSSEVFEQLNSFYHFVKDASRQPTLGSPSKFFDAVRQHALLWSGIIDGTMSHDTGWHFINVGRLLERADKTSRILDVKYFNLLPEVDDIGTAIDDMQWSALLLAISGFEAYRRDHHMIDIEKVVRFFLFNPNFPRSVLFCVAGADWSLREIHEDSHSQEPGAAKQQISKLRKRLSETSVKHVIAGGMHEFVDHLQTELNGIGNSMHEDFFS